MSLSWWGIRRTGSRGKSDSRRVQGVEVRTRTNKNISVLTECWNHDGTPNKFNYRHECAKLMAAHADQVPWFGLEQEYTLLDSSDRPFGWPAGVCSQMFPIKHNLLTFVKRVSPLLKAHTTVVLAPARLSSVISSSLTSVPASTLASQSPAPTPRSCPLSGSTKSALARVSRVSRRFECNLSPEHV